MTSLLLLAATQMSDIITAETFVLTVLGLFGTFIVQAIKKYAGTEVLSGTKALNVTLLVSIVLSAVGVLATDGFIGTAGGWTIASITKGSLIVFGLSTIVYKYLLSKDSPVTP